MWWQPWATLAGLGADMVGVALLAVEWFRAFDHAFEVRSDELQAAYERNEARERHRKVVDRRGLEEETMAKEFSKLHHQEGRIRRSLVFFSLALILAGFTLQAAGAWPM
jgi:hypothetical protein